MAPRTRSALDDLPRVAVTSADELRQWLLAHHAGTRGAWAVTFKKGQGPHVPYDALVRAALCFGWVDSLPRALDARRTMLLLTPRKPKSGWSLANKTRILELETAGLMHPSGAAVVAAARQSGAWDKLKEVSALVVPGDLAVALRALPPAEANFAAFPPSTRRGILEWLGNSRTAPTRENRVREIASLAQRNQRANQWPRQKSGSTD
jgi:uncharacterized protein YdeI (YjbR/CyaY-like superfamily)